MIFLQEEAEKLSTEFWIGMVIQLAVYGASIGVIYGTLKTRLNYLEKKIDKHNQVVERTYNLETKVAVLEKEKEVANHRIADLEAEKVGC